MLLVAGFLACSGYKESAFPFFKTVADSALELLIVAVSTLAFHEIPFYLSSSTIYSIFQFSLEPFCVNKYDLWISKEKDKNLARFNFGC